MQNRAPLPGPSLVGNRIPPVSATAKKALGELRRLVAGRLTLTAAVWLAAGLAQSAFVVWGFAEITEGVVKGESRAFDRAVLLWIGANVPGWLDGPMRVVTALGYYSVVLPLLVAVSLSGLLPQGLAALGHDARGLDHRGHLPDHRA